VACTQATAPAHRWAPPRGRGYTVGLRPSHSSPAAL